MVRAASGSLLACVLLHAALQGVGLAAVGMSESLPIAGFNAPGPHTPAEIVALCAISVLAGVLMMLRVSRRESEAAQPEPDPDPS